MCVCIPLLVGRSCNVSLSVSLASSSPTLPPVSIRNIWHGKAPCFFDVARATTLLRRRRRRRRRHFLSLYSVGPQQQQPPQLFSAQNGMKCLLNCEPNFHSHSTVEWMPTRENDLEQTQTSKRGRNLYSVAQHGRNLILKSIFPFFLFKSKIMRCKNKNWWVSIPSKKITNRNITGRVAFLVYRVVYDYIIISHSTWHKYYTQYYSRLCCFHIFDPVSLFFFSYYPNCYERWEGG